MFNILKFDSKLSDKIFFLSDLHHCHSLLLESRDFKTVEEHNTYQIEEWNKKVTNESIVFLLGDTVLGAGEKSTEVFENLLNVLSYKELYIMGGNHGAGYKKLFEKYLGGSIDIFYRLSVNLNGKIVHFIPNYYEIFIGRQPIILSHYSILSWRDQSKGSFHLFGHSHDSLKTKDWIRDNYLIGKCLDVGWDAFRAPVSFSEIKVIMDAKKITSCDHHTEETKPSF